MSKGILGDTNRCSLNLLNIPHSFHPQIQPSVFVIDKQVCGEKQDTDLPFVGSRG